MRTIPSPLTPRKKQRYASLSSYLTFQLLVAVVLIVFISIYSGGSSSSISSSYSVYGYSTGAGSCPLGRSAVSGSHLETNSGSKTIVRRGQPLKRLGIELQIDGERVEPDATSTTGSDSTNTSDKPFWLYANTDYKIQVVAVGTNSSKSSDNSTTATTKASSDCLKVP